MTRWRVADGFWVRQGTWRMFIGAHRGHAHVVAILADTRERGDRDYPYTPAETTQSTAWLPARSGGHSGSSLLGDMSQNVRVVAAWEMGLVWGRHPREEAWMWSGIEQVGS